MLKQTTARLETESKSMVSQVSSLLGKTNTENRAFGFFFSPELEEQERPTAPFP